MVDNVATPADRPGIAQIVHSTDNSVYQVVPADVSTPADADDVRDLLRRNASTASPQPVAARGGGTGTNGQSLTDGIVLDVKRGLNRILEVDVDAATAVVEPGVVAGRLNAELRPHGLHWAPHTSTLNRATVGGMISTDAAGKGSLVHGRTHRHVRRLDIVLADGTPWVAEPVTVAEAERRAGGDDPGAALWQSLLDLPVDKSTTFDLPELARGWSGYGVDRLRRDGLIDPTALLCGAEGTLGVIVSATLSLTPIPARTWLAVAFYESFDLALEDAVRLRDTGPTAIECFDETTLDRGRGSPAWPALGAVVGERQGAVLLLEYTDGPDLGALQTEVLAGGRCVDVDIVDDPSEQASIWKVRADAVGLLAKEAVGLPDRSARPTAFVEDCAVPVEQMPAFIADFRRLLDDEGVVYGMFGHADVGCVHVRPALDLTDADERSRHERLTRQVTELVHGYGGLLWGEHGRGFRGGTVDEVLDPDTLALMRRIKTSFDPHDLLNPGKLYRPTGTEAPVVGVAEAPLRGARDEAVPVDLRRRFGDAFACNGNALCQQWDQRQAMCPSYLATGDPALSPKGRADLIREWLANRRGDRRFEAELVENLDQCLSCGACTGQCPVEVDIPELKSQVFESIGRRPFAHRVMGSFEDAAWLGSLAPPLVRPFLPMVGWATKLVDLPTPLGRRRAQRRFSKRRRGELVLLPDVFTSALEPDTLAHVAVLLESLELEVSVAPFVPSGKFEHVKGHRRRFLRIAKRQQILLRQLAWSHCTPVVIEPAVALLHRHEYPTMLEEYPSELVRTLPEILLDHLDELLVVGEGRTVVLLGHCTETATAPEQRDAWERILSAAGYTVETPPVGCCGMAGVFGHEPANQQISRALWDQSWAEVAQPSEDRLVVATGYSCRSQSGRFGSRLTHPVHLLTPRPRPGDRPPGQ